MRDSTTGEEDPTGDVVTTVSDPVYDEKFPDLKRPHLSSQATADDIRALYEKTNATVAYFLDWRHKVLTLWLAVTSGTITVSGWMLTHKAAKGWSGVPLLLGGLFAFMAAGMDQRNQAILNANYRIAEYLETQLGLTGGPLSAIPATRAGVFTYHRIGLIVWLGSGLLLVAAGIYFAISYG